MSKRFYYDDFLEEIYDEQIDDYPSNLTICGILNDQQQRIAELEEQLKNAIVPKFMVGQEVWFVNEILEVIHNGKINAFEVYKFKERPYEFWYDIDYVEDNTETSDEVSDEFVFATKEQAQAKLKELKGE